MLGELSDDVGVVIFGDDHDIVEGDSCKSTEHAGRQKRSTVSHMYEIMRKYGCMEFTTIVAAWELQAMMQSKAPVYHNSKDMKKGKEEVIKS